MVLSRQLKGVTLSMVLWFAVSLLPFGIDWAFENVAAEIALVLTAVLIALVIDYKVTSSAGLQRDGIRATAVVLEVKKPLMNVVVNNVYIKRKLRVRIERDDGAAPYEASYSDLFMIGDVPDPGESFRVVVDPAKPQRMEAAEAGRGRGPTPQVAPVAAPATGRGSASGRTTWRFTSWKGTGSRPSYAPYRPEPSRPASTSTSAGGRDVTAALQQLADLHEKGQLTDEEFAIAKRELLGG
ncbi:hypothetical protein F0U44_21495 [Nocardioides humilatus]|uniref:SHOCT domain-containing protein n=2 Tax=Nocardioides humilatus TaxID=2607660 RepID=A0A5B1L6G1_9ACTN|nr:hypothetical protein F0U44_21495 [Nocardioides humilatus]